MIFKDLTKEQQDKCYACKDADEILSFVKEEGFELSDQQLEAVSGGGWGEVPTCPYCGSKNIYQGESKGGFPGNGCRDCLMLW